MCRANFCYSNFFFRNASGARGGGGRGGGLKLGLHVFHHNNNFNAKNIYCAKTITIEK